MHAALTNCCRNRKFDIFGSTLYLQVWGRLYSQVFSCLDFELYEYFITIYGYVLGYIQRDLNKLGQLVQPSIDVRVSSKPECTPLLPKNIRSTAFPSIFHSIDRPCLERCLHRMKALLSTTSTTLPTSLSIIPPLAFCMIFSPLHFLSSRTHKTGTAIRRFWIWPLRLVRYSLSIVGWLALGHRGEVIVTALVVGVGALSLIWFRDQNQSRMQWRSINE